MTEMWVDEAMKVMFTVYMVWRARVCVCVRCVHALVLGRAYL